MKKFAVLLCCLLILTLLACKDSSDKPPLNDDKVDSPLSQVSVCELASLNKGDQALVTAVVTGKMGDKLYVSDETGAFELIDVPIMLWLQCSAGHRIEFTVKVTDEGVAVTKTKKISSKNSVADAIALTSLRSLDDYLYQKVSADGLTIVKIEGDIFDGNQDARITVSNGEGEAVILISTELPAADRQAIATALHYPMAGDVLDISGAFITNASGAVIELGAPEQISAVKESIEKINVERIERDVADLSVDVGERLSYRPQTQPANANNLNYLTYTVSDTSIAYIDENGDICGKAYGKTFLHIEQTGSNKVIIPIYVEPRLDFGYDKWSPSRIDETPRPVSNLDELRAEFLNAALGSYREIYIDFNLSEPIRAADVNRLFEYKYLASFPLATVIGGDNVTFYQDELVKFTFLGWEGEVMYGPYEIPTEQSGVNLIDAASLLRQKYVIENSPYKRNDSFEDFPIIKENRGTIAVYNPSQLVWALEYNLLPTFPLENSKAEYIYNQAKDVLRDIITDDMTELQKCKAIFDYICQNAVYAVDYYDRAQAVDYYPPEQTVIGFFERGRVVCEGYAETFVLLAGIEGIEAHRIQGDIEQHRLGGHMWNAVVIDGKWYEICATQSDHTMRGWPDNWFDEEAEGQGHDTHSYRHFLVNNEYFKAYYPYQTPSAAQYSQIYDVHLIDQLPDKDFDYIIESPLELEKVLREVIGLGLQGNFYINLSFRGMEPSFELLAPIMNGLGFKGEYTYSTPQQSLNGKDVFHTLSFHTESK